MFNFLLELIVFQKGAKWWNIKSWKITVQGRPNAKSNFTE